jgi:hypothetical protein
MLNCWRVECGVPCWVRASLQVRDQRQMSLSLMEYEWAWLSKSEVPTMAQVRIYLSDVRTIRDAKIRDAHTREAPTSELDSRMRPRLLQ